MTPPTRLDAASMTAPEGTAEAENLEAFGRVFLLILIAEHWTRSIALWQQLDAEGLAHLAAATALAGLAWMRRTRWLGFTGLAVVQVLVLHRDFPQAGNHAYLELILCSLLALLSPRVAEERRLLRTAVRWVVCLVLFWSGVQKLVHGYYFHGEQLAYSLRIESFRPVLSLLLPSAELSRLAAYTGEVGDGPYRLESLPFLAISNGVYLAEITLAGLLLATRARALAVACALGFLFAVELAAREVFFGLLFVNALLLFPSAAVHGRALPVFGALLLALTLVRLGVLPSFVFY